MVDSIASNILKYSIKIKQLRNLFIFNNKTNINNQSQSYGIIK
jgi:hypothetical protein